MNLQSENERLRKLLVEARSAFLQLESDSADAYTIAPLRAMILSFDAALSVPAATVDYNSLRARLQSLEQVAEGLADHLEWILPMARGYAYVHAVGRNHEMCTDAGNALARYRAAQPVAAQPNLGGEENDTGRVNPPTVIPSYPASRSVWRCERCGKTADVDSRACFCRACEPVAAQREDKKP